MNVFVCIGMYICISIILRKGLKVIYKKKMSMITAKWKITIKRVWLKLTMDSCDTGNYQSTPYLA